MRLWMALAALIVWIAAAMRLLVAMDQAVRFRIDLPAGSLPFSGRHPIWQVNVFDPRNYSYEGRSAYRRLVTTAVVTLVAAFVCLAILLTSVAGAI
jgi:hypothetical protein